MSAYQIILAEYHQGLRRLVRQKLEGTDEFEVVGEVNDGQELLDLLERVTPDLIILDISIPDLGGMETAKRIQRSHPEMNILFLSMHRNPVYVKQAQQLGVAGYLLKEDLEESLLPAINRIRSGQTYISPTLVPYAQARRNKKKPDSKIIHY